MVFGVLPRLGHRIIKHNPRFIKAKTRQKPRYVLADRAPAGL